MARRKRKAFGYSTVEHRRRARFAAAEFRADIAALKKNLAAGNCARAFANLKSVLRTEGSYHAHRAAVTGRTFPREGGTIRQIEPLSHRFLSVCLVGKGF